MALKPVLFALILAGLIFSASGCQELIKKYGNRISLPSTVSNLFQGSTVGLEVATSSGAITANGKVTSNGIDKITCGTAMTDYTVYLKESAVYSLQKASASSRTSTFISLMKKGDIRLAAHGYMSNLKLSFAKMLLGAN